jgi:membrane fusion protein (multidrug efflux system)
VIVVKNGVAEFKKVETGIRTENYVQITDGLEIGDTVVTTALMYIKPEMPLKVTKLMP